LGRGLDAAFGRFDRSDDCFSRRLSAYTLLQCLHERIERIQHGPIAEFRTTQLADGHAALVERFGPLREFGVRGLQNLDSPSASPSIGIFLETRQLHRRRVSGWLFWFFPRNHWRQNSLAVDAKSGKPF
jgi:hypothetical protein